MKSLFIGDKNADLSITNKKIISNTQNDISIADTFIIGQTFYAANSSITDLPKDPDLNSKGTFNVVTYEVDDIPGFIFIYQFLFWDGNNGNIWFRSTYKGREVLKQQTWKQVSFK